MRILCKPNKANIMQPVLPADGIKMLTDHIYRLTGNVVTDDNQRVLITHCSIQVLKRKQMIQQPGRTCRSLTFIISGAMRMYAIDEQGRDITVNLAVESCWIFDPKTLIPHNVSDYYIEATERTVVLQIPAAQIDLLKLNVPGFATMFEMHSLNSVIATQKRLLASMSMLAGRRYTLFKQDYPAYVNRFPQTTLASFLGMSSETLSRIVAGQCFK